MSSDNLKISRLTINFNLIYHTLQLFDLCHSEYSKCHIWLEWRHGNLSPLVNGIVNDRRSVLLQSTRQSDAASIHSHPALFLVDSLLNYAQEFVVNWIEVMAVRRQQT